MSEPTSDTPAASDALWSQGFARLGIVLDRPACEELRATYEDNLRFRSRIDMARYRFGQGEYKYFSYPLPTAVADLRERFYAQLAPLARAWMAALKIPCDYPPALPRFTKLCHAAGQTRPTPLLLRYRAGDYNCLHQDLYGAVVFPFQVIVALSEPDREYSGGELLLVEQRPRAQSMGRALSLAQGEAIVVTTRYRPAQGTRGVYRSTFRHGVSPVLRGERFALGLVFHDAE
jgi:hypothetical protein